MIAHRQGHGIWAAIVCCAALALAGCGADGTSSLHIPPPNPNPGPSVSGTVYAPNGQFAASERWWQWADVLRLMPAAFAALQGELPVTSEESVSLSKLDPAEAAHGDPETGQYLLAKGATDPADGTYLISSNQLADPQTDSQGGEIIVQVGSGETLTRAFVLPCTTGTDYCADINAANEAVVRLVLNRLLQAPAVQLTDFTADGLQKVCDYAQQALSAMGISGVSVGDCNDNAYEMLASNKTIHNMIDDACGAAAGTP
jgi:hypothetical protein